MATFVDAPNLDTELARALHATGRISLDRLQEELERARQGRETGAPTLARRLVDGGHLAEAEVEQVLRAVAGKMQTRALPQGAPAGEATGAPGVKLHELPTAPRIRSTDGGDARWRAGARIDRYQLERRLGSGGMGTVYLAREVTTGKPFALKALSTSADPGIVLRFAREAEVQRILARHPNLVRIHATGQAAGKHYFVMDLLEGGDLDARLAAGPLSPEEAATIVRDVARGLAYVHANGILHRDLKPANIIFDDAGTPKLVDFGLAKVLDGDTLTQTGDVLGTPAFMAPEQVEGRHREQDERTDVYGLGAVLYVLLTGQLPFSGKTYRDVFLQVTNEEPAPPRSWNPAISPALEAVCLRALEKEPAERFHSAHALAKALDEALDAVAPTAPAPRRGRRGRGPLGVLLVLSGLSVGVLGAVALGTGPAQPPLPLGAGPVPSPTPLPTAAPEPNPEPAAPGLPRTVAELEPYTATEPPDWLPTIGPMRFVWEQAQRGDPGSLVLLGQGLRQGASGLPQRPALAAQCFRRAVDEGSARGWAELGQLFSWSGPVAAWPVKPVARVEDEALHCYRRAANLGDPMGMAQLGLVCFYGTLGQEIDTREAARRFTQAAESERRDDSAYWWKTSIIHLGLLATDREPTVELDVAEHWLRAMRLEFPEGPQAKLTLARVLLRRPGDAGDAEAYQLLVDAADDPKPLNASADAMVWLFWMHRLHRSPLVSAEAARAWLERAAAHPSQGGPSQRARELLGDLAREAQKRQQQ